MGELRTVTFLFTDVEGSTRLLRELGDGYGDALAAHRAVVREAVARHGGVEVDTQGDAFFCVFADAAGALRAAAEAQSSLRLPVRMGVHTGAARAGDGGYVGLEVHRAARIAAVAHGGQVVLSQAARDTLSPKDDMELKPLGEHRLKDFDEAVTLFQLGAGAFPPLRTIANTNLPRPASSFVGREREVAEVASLLRDGARLVTLTGPGGTGKTRLALEAAAELVPGFAAGVFWVGLAPLRDAALVGETIARTLGAGVDLAADIGERELLLLLDNLEQVMDAAPELAGLVERCPNLRLLVTSRELLRVRGETEVPVPPLPRRDAAALFGARSGLAADETVVELCARLDDLPLAVELAAARTRVLSPRQILDRLGGRLDLLRGGRDADARQRTLRAAIEWSHELLEPREQRLFARLAVFSRGCSLDAAEQVAGADVDDLQELVDKNLLRHTDERFWMLETIREYARERLDASEEAAALRRRHAEFFLELAESAHLTFAWYEQRPELVADDVDNLRAAIAWARSADDVALALRIALALEMFWVFTNPREGMRWYERLLEDGGVEPALRARALLAYGSCANPAGEDALAEQAYDQSYAAFLELGDRWAVPHLLLRLGSSALYRGDVTRARELADESLAGARGVDDRATEALALWLAGDAEQALGHDDTAVGLIRASADIAREIGFTWHLTRMLRRLGDWELAHGDAESAARAVEESLRLSFQLGDRISTVFSLARLALLAAERGDDERAGHLWGAIEAEEARGALGAWSGERRRFEEPLLERAGAAFERGRAAGRALTLEEAVAEASFGA